MRFPSRRTLSTIAFLILFTLLMATLSAHAATYYISPQGNDANPGTLTEPWATLLKANRTLEPGDTVYLREGEYARQLIRPARSGTEDQYITYAAYPGETPVVTDVRTAIDLRARSYIRIDGITVDGKYDYERVRVSSWAQIFDSHHIVIENSAFYRAGGWNCFFLDQGSTHIIIRNNVFDQCGTWQDINGEDSGDLLTLNDAHYNLVENNVFSRGGHNLLNNSGRFNVFRNNVFDNRWGHNRGNRSVVLISYRGNKDGGWSVFEGNVIYETLPASDNPISPAMKVEGFNYIVRRNFLIGGVGYGIQTHTRTEDPTAKLNKIYHNVLYDFAYAPWWLNIYGVPDEGAHTNVFKNNLVFQSAKSTGSRRSMDVVVRATLQPKGGGMQNNEVVANAFYSEEWEDAPVSVAGIGERTLSWFEANYPESFRMNVQAAPEIVSKEPLKPIDFQLSPSSPLIDRGDFLTRTVGAGTGTTLVVADAGYFYDGFGISEPDWIQVGPNAPVKIVSIDYETHEITVAEPISWSDGDGVSLPYEGAAPDIGAWESPYNL